VIGQVTARMRGRRLAKCPKQNLTALMPKGGE
jgi:hypothetical protein